MQHYLKDVQSVLDEQETTKQGLTSKEAAERLEIYGPNKLVEAEKGTIFQKVLEQLSDPMVIVLIAAAVISGIVGEIVDTIIIMMVVVLNAVLGVVQEGKAEQAIEALQNMAAPYSTVRRKGRVFEAKAETIVPGDIVLLEAGDSVPADMRIIESASLKIEEASLTGESVPVDKTADTLHTEGDEVALGDRSNMAYMGTNVVYGRGEGVVVGTGMSTEIGKIAHIITTTEEDKTPLQIKLASLSRVLSVAVLAISVIIFVVGVLQNGGFTGGNVLDMFLTAVSLAVAAIPEGLVAVVTIVLSIGVTRMSQRNAIIRRLTAVETLGSTQIICSDKTGTLTQNKMTVVDSFGDESLLVKSMALCNDATVDHGNEVMGEPTETALVRYALAKGANKRALEQEMPRVAEVPFDSGRKMMSTVHKDDNGDLIQYVKGAPDALLDKCTQMVTPDGIVPLTDQLRREIESENKRMAGEALRVLGSAMKPLPELPAEVSAETLERDLIFVGLAGMIDPVRPEVQQAIQKCREAGIRPIMITGDHKDTAVAIAKELRMVKDETEAITGVELSQMSDEEFEREIQHYSVYARVQPEHKVRIVKTWKKYGKLTAMTGDGVNDAPALKSADIGVGMGITGTDVTKNVSDMVLADDNFASIVSAVEEGRRIYENIRKAIQFLLSSNLSEVIALFVATIMNFRLFSPVHILWINLVTDSLPAIALGMEPAEEDIMRRPPRNRDEGIFANGLGVSVIYQGTLVAILTLISYFVGNGQSHEIGMTMAFVTLAMCEVFHSINLRSRTKSIFGMHTHNKYLFAAMIAAAVLTIAVVYVPGLNEAFKLTALSLNNLLTAVGLAFSIIPIVELVKLITRVSSARTDTQPSR